MRNKNIFNDGFFDINKEIVKPKMSKLIDNISRSKIPILSDEEGLSKAYEQPNKIYINNHKTNIAGTSTLQDVWYDLKTTFHLTKHSKRYEDADKLFKDNPQIDDIVGHSLGGAVALELNKNYPDKYDTTTYGSPTFDFGNEKGKRFRHTLDPISIFDRNANNVPLDIEDLLNPYSEPIIDIFNPFKNHSYQGYGEQGKDDEGNIGTSSSYSRKTN